MWKRSIAYRLSYDAIGNMTSYADWTYEWEAGRKLKQQTQNLTVVAYEYDQNGMRVRKTVKNRDTGYVYNQYEYSYEGKRLVHMTRGGNVSHFYYDAQGRPAMMQYNGVMYTYVLNLQGDVIAILDSNGAKKVEYKYDAWGYIKSKTGSMSSTLGFDNPFRYRGYIYDEKTWMYWLRSRYYYPELMRFIIADENISSVNLFCYCNNCPIVQIDSDGELAQCSIHNAVQRHIVMMNHGISAEKGVRMGGDFGRIDLIRYDTGEVWEIKPATREYYALEGMTRLNDYMRGIVINPRTLMPVRLKIGGSLPDGYFYYTEGNETAFVEYRYIGFGIITYDYRLIKTTKNNPKPSVVFDTRKQEKKRKNGVVIPFPNQSTVPKGNSIAAAALAGLALGGMYVMPLYLLN